MIPTLFEQPVDVQQSHQIPHSISFFRDEPLSDPDGGLGVARRERLLATTDVWDRCIEPFDGTCDVGEQGRLDERDIACAQQDRAFVAARAQLFGAFHECDERPFARIVDGRQAGACLDTDRKDWVRYLRERARNAHGEPDAAEVDRRLIATHAARRASGEKEARRVTWLDQITTSLANETGVDVSDLELSPDAVRALLDVARVASHSSGERIYAPLLCYVLGNLSARGVPLDQAIAVVEENAKSE